jgi:hypothetical protein
VDNTFADVWTVDSDFVLEPRNAAANAQPWTAVRRLRGSNFRFATATGETVKITGKFGWASVPAQVREATTILASKLLRRAREAPFGVVTVGLDVGAIARIAQLDPDVSFLLGSFVRGRPFA